MLLAGFAHMPRARFYAINVFSALLWAPAHILPGVLFGTSLALAKAVSGRLVLMLLLVVVLVWSVAWLVSTAIRVGVPRVRRLRDAAVEHARGRASAVARATLALLDPQQPGSHALLWGTMVVLGAGWLFLGVVEDVLSHDPLTQADVAVFNLLQGLRSQPFDHLMVAITELGSVGVMLPLIAVVLVWLAWRRCWRTAAYWAGTAAFAELLVQLLKATLGRHRPIHNLYAGVEQFSFPSGHATVSTVVLAFLAFLLSRGRARAIRLGIAMTAAVYVVLVAFSRLYLGAHWLSDVLGGMSLGTAWVAFVAMGQHDSATFERTLRRAWGSRSRCSPLSSSLAAHGSTRERRTICTAMPYRLSAGSCPRPVGSTAAGSNCRPSGWSWRATPKNPCGFSGRAARKRSPAI